MARIILKSPYLKPNSQTHMDNYVRHVAYHGGVERPADSRQQLPATVFQKKTVAQIIKDYSDTTELYEYEDYINKPTRANAEEFIIRAVESHPELLESREQYVSYIATRPGAVHVAGHGLFGDADQPVILDHVMEEVKNHTGNVWCHIVSLRREDAERLGYDQVSAWQDLLCSQRNTIAAAMNIHPNNFRWYASFHNKEHHPHVHLVAWSTKPSEPWLTEKGIGDIKAALAKQIFKNDLMQIYERQTEQRDALRQDYREIAAEIVGHINSGGYDNPVVEKLLLELADRLNGLSGKKVYGYLPPDVKATVDLIVDELAKDDRIARLYDLWYEQKQEVLRTYTDKPVARVPLSQNDDFKPVKNAVIEEAQNILLDRLTFEDDEQLTVDNGQLTVSESPNGDDLELPFPSPSDFDEAESDAESIEYFADWTKEYKEARAYLYGSDHVEQDFAIAYSLLLAEANKGNAFALYDVARMHKDGLGRDKDMDTAQDWFAKAYRAFLAGERTCEKNGYLQFRLGKMNAQGFGVEQNYEAAADWYKRAVAQDNPFAAYALGGLYYRGQGVEKDYRRAFDLYTQAAEHPKRPNVFAMYELGRMCRDGIGTEADQEQSRRWFAQAYNGFVSLARQTKDDKLQYRLGQMCLTGTGTAVNLYAARDYFEQTAKLGSADAMYGLGKLYLDPKFDDHDAQQAIRWLAAAVKEEHEYARYTLGKLFLKGELVEKDIEYGLRLLHQAADQGNQWAQLLLGKTYLAGIDAPQDFELAEAMLEAAAGQSNATAQYTLAKMHLNGQVGNPSVTHAVELLEAAAWKRHTGAQYTLGRLLMQGDLIPKDILRAERFLLDAAQPHPKPDDSGEMDRGNQSAQYLLGKLYLSEDGIQKDAKKAARFFAEAAEQNNQWAQYQLGKMLLYGKEIEKDADTGIALLSASAAQGNVYAQKVLDSYYSYRGYKSKPSVSAALGAMRLLGRLAQIMKHDLDEEARRDGSAGLIDRKLRRQIAEKKEAMGLKLE